MKIILNKAENAFIAFKQSASSLWDRCWEKYEDFSHSSTYEAITPFSIGASKIFYLSNYFFENATPSPLTQTIQEFINSHEFTKSIYDFVTTQPIASTVNFVMLGSLFFESRNNIIEREKAKLSGDNEKIMNADMNAVSLAGKYCNAPTTIKDFLTVCKIPFSTFFSLATSALEGVSLIFSTVEIVQSGFQMRSTAKLIENLKYTGHLAFLNAYKASNQPDSAQVSFNELSPQKIKNQVKAIKGRLSNQPDLLKGLKHISNQAFIQAVSQKAKDDPESLEMHFKIRAKHFNVIEKLALPENQNKDLTSAVGLIKKRLEQKTHSDLFTMAYKGIKLIPSIITLVAAFTTINPVLFPVGAAISLVIAVAALVHITVTSIQKKMFKNGLAQVVA